MKYKTIIILIMCTSVIGVCAQDKAGFIVDKKIPAFLEITGESFPPNRIMKSKVSNGTNVERLLQLNKNTSAILVDTLTDKVGGFHESYVEYYKGIKVENTRCIVHYDEYGNGVLVNGNFRTIENLDVNPLLKESTVLEKVYEHISSSHKIQNVSLFRKRIQEKDNVPNGQLLVYFVLDTPYLVYKIPIPELKSYYYIDANNGKILYECSMCHHISTTVNTRFSNYQNIETSYYNGNYILSENTRGCYISTYKYNLAGNDDLPTTYYVSPDNTWSSLSTFDRAALDAHWGAEKTYDYYKNKFNRNSYNNNGAAIVSVVNCFESYNPQEGAYWDTNYNLIRHGFLETTSNGNLTTYIPSVSLGIVGHEFTHAVTQCTSNLRLENESGAINEGLSDVFGLCIQREFKPLLQNTWILEDQTNHPKNLSNPTCKYYHGPQWYPNSTTPNSANDYGGIHNNSGVFSYWFYLLCEGGSGTHTASGFYYSVDSIGMEKAIQLFYLMNTSYLTPYSTFSQAKTCSIYAAKQLGFSSHDIEQIRKAWLLVGVGNPELSIDGTAYIANTATYRVLDVPTGYYVIWEISGLISGFLNLQQNTPDANACTLNRIFTFNETGQLIAKVYSSDNNLVNTITKDICIIEHIDGSCVQTNNGQVVYGSELHPEACHELCENGIVTLTSPHFKYLRKKWLSEIWISDTTQTSLTFNKLNFNGPNYSYVLRLMGDDGQICCDLEFRFCRPNNYYMASPSISAKQVGNSLKIKIENIEKEPSVLEVYNALTGKRETMIRMKEKTYTLDTSGFTSGLYVIRVIAGDEICYDKIIIR